MWRWMLETVFSSPRQGSDETGAHLEELHGLMSGAFAVDGHVGGRVVDRRPAHGSWTRS